VDFTVKLTLGDLIQLVAVILAAAGLWRSSRKMHLENSIRMANIETKLDLVFGWFAKIKGIK
jgi:hypothetical protein